MRQMCRENRNDMIMEKQAWFFLFNLNRHACVLLEFIILSTKSPEKLNKIGSKLFFRIDNATLHSINSIISRE